MTEPIGLSTSWNGPGSNPAQLLEQDRGLGFRRIEAYAHFTLDALRALAAAAAERGMHIGSLHGPCPVAQPPTGDWLASTNPSESSRAVDAHRRTIDAAAEVGAKAIVVHLGNTGVGSRQPSIFDTIGRFGRLSDEHLRLREAFPRDERHGERRSARGLDETAAIETHEILPLF